ncbi:hypothetical protein TVAG_446100 [Trichomonas vaginalis G3]|uniref:Uncharacterized protein n=1 Tax=Trichomonas vaginalis (strain ATCC PRA-98 / G3) TaxID=412133 RepID=A2FXR9_TRIV3|nr:hypothetical protein TVAG_446100 [Trichomonas vaginalis G3]|eukprot:XP_001303240.1 hypothetical protein [Trichomonas vaginalis G3]
MEVEQNCFELQKEIHKQTLLLKVLNDQIDRNQVSVTTMMKQLLISKFLFINRLTIMENCDKSQMKKFIKQLPMKTDKIEAADSFTSLDLPDDFSTVPFKSFLNSLFDSFEQFLPAFYKIDITKLPKNKSLIHPSITLLRTVFPALFAYCWADEPAKSYANQLIYWFSQILIDNKGNYADAFNNWFCHAVRGFYSCLNLLPFMRETFHEILIDFIQIYNSSDKFVAKYLLTYAETCLEKIQNNFYLLPDVLNNFYQQFFKLVDECEYITDKEVEKNNLIRILFFDCLIKPVFINLLLYGVCEIPMANEDAQYFSNIYQVFESKFKSKERLPEIDKELQQMQEFQSFNPFVVIDLINESKAKQKLPSLASFCDIVQCAHQPIFFTTKSLLILYRFIVSIQQFSDFPKSIERPIKNITEQTLDDALEDIDELPFWFPCYSMKYLGIDNIEIKKKKNNSSLYKLFSSPSIILNPNQNDVKKALQESLNLINTTTESKIKSEMLYILKNTDVTTEISNLRKEIKDVQKLLTDRKERSKLLNLFSRELSELTQLTSHSGVKIAIASSLFAEFMVYSNNHQQVAIFDKVIGLVDSFLGPASEFLGKYLLMQFTLMIKPSSKIQKKKYIKPDTDDVETELRSMVSPPINVSGILPKVLLLSKDVSTILMYGMMNGIEIPVMKCYSPPFIENPAAIAKTINEFMNDLSPEVRNKIFDERELQAIEVFLLTFLSK